LFWMGAGVAVLVGFVPTVVMAAVTWAFDRERRLLHRWTGALVRLFVRWPVAGGERIPEGAAVFVANHRGLIALFAIYGIRRPFKWVAKSSLFRIPLLGWWMHLCRYIPVTRGNPKSIARMYETCGEWLDRGMPVLLFPEGTWSPEGGLGAFKEGAFKLAVEKQCPVVPIAVSDRSVRVLEPVEPGTDPAELRDQVRARLEAALTSDSARTGIRTAP
jgi:1-acyl-sn-glycerol-3-phosphate acyltransferase